MAVYKRTYRPYGGLLTDERTRFLVLPRFAIDDLLVSRLLIGYLVLCFLPILIETAIIYVEHSEAARALISMRGNLVPIDAKFFRYCITFQGGMAFLLAAWVGPTLVSPDLANNALPLFLSRPFSRFEYVLGKASVLLFMLSVITWVPVLGLFFLQAGTEGQGWYWTNGYMARAIVLGGLLWVSILSLLSLAISAWVRWRIVASALLFGIFFVLAGFGEAINSVLRTYWGRIINLQYLMNVVWNDLFGLPMLRRGFRRGFRGYSDLDIPSWAAWAALVTICCICVLLLNKRLRAREVVK